MRPCGGVVAGGRWIEPASGADRRADQLGADGAAARPVSGPDPARRIARELTGHTSDSAFEVYVRGASGYRLARQAQEHLERIFAPVLEAADAGANQRQASGSGMGRPTGKSSGKGKSAG
ncbi:MAG: hypothetical protein K2X46_17325 [Roseomonas sp.]|nr:hypothetical protein [Roseomonas sp.]